MSIRIKFVEGGPMILPTSPPIALCRCGYSNDKPYCDGAHTMVMDDYGSSPDLPEFTLIIPFATLAHGGDTHEDN